MTPTLAILEAKTVPGYVRDGGEAAWEEQPAVVAQYWRAASAEQRERGQAYFDGKRGGFEARLATLRELHLAGVAILVGSDAGNPSILPGRSLYRELELLVAAGFTPREALFAATLGAARFLGLDDSGELKAGQAADLVLLDANPLADISNVRKVAGVVRGGRWIEPR